MNKLQLTTLLSCVALPQIYAQERPNILWLTYEDTSPQFIGCYGNKDARTPHIDQLATEGVRFDNAYSTGAVSSASRFCLITGIPAAQMGTGNHRSNYPIAKHIKGFPYYLRQAGYYTTNNSKTDYNLANAKAFTKEAWNESSNKAGWWNRKEGQPFFAVYNSNASHQSRTMTNSWADYEKMVLEKLNRDETITPGGLEIPAVYRNSEDMQKHISRVYNSITLMDKEFGQWLERLEKDGLKDSTIIFCFSDHGEGITRGKGSALGMGYRVAFVAWFPPIYKHLSPWGDGVITDEMVSFEDMAPTMLALAGVEIPEHMNGRVFAGKQVAPRKEYVYSSLDRTDESSELSRSITDGEYLYTKVFMPYQPFVRWNIYYDVSDLQKTIRGDFEKGYLNSIQRAILEPREAEYLYNLKNDKWEVNNLANNPNYSKIKATLRAELEKKIIANRDPHFMTEYEVLSSKLNPVELASCPTHFPIDQVLSVAMSIGVENGYKTQLDGIKSHNKFIRYWAGVGLFSQPQLKNSALQSLEKAIASETFIPAKVTHTMTLYKHATDKKYLNQVRELLMTEDTEALRMALHLLVSMESNKINPLISDLKKMQELEVKDKSRAFMIKDLIKLILHSQKEFVINHDNS